MDLTYTDLVRPCNCYKSSELSETILDSTQTANFRERYVLGDQLGWGRFGIIRECSDKLTREVLACKSIAKERLVTEDDVRSVKLEIEILTKLSGHENIVDLKAVYEEEDYVHLLMELCAGGELFHRIEKQGRLSEHEARIIFKQFVEVVMYCHDKGIMHRDLKPENILLVSRSSSSPIKLADFGLATYIKPGQTLHGTVGSPFYIAPEVLVGGYNQAADVWSAGVILYILLSGMPPFWGKTKSAIFDAVRAANLCFHSDPWDNISMSAKDLISRMLCFDPSKRITAAQVLGMLIVWMLVLTPGQRIPHGQVTQELYGQDNLSYQQLEVGSYSFSSLNAYRDHDFSFRDGSPVIVNSEQEDSPVFSCRSSFSSILINQGTPSSVSGAVYPGSCCKTNAAEFSSPIHSIPSFTFFSPIPTLEESDESLCFKTKMLSIDGDPAIQKLILFPDNECPTEQKSVEMEERCNIHPRGVSSASKATSLQSKRNHTISFGELDHLDLIATASVSRWASCTRIPSAASLRSSLVC
ncbi:UNVERIFIED_CONTAM: Calcium-dependent protein kinase [Sesamum latifolium]|uniref:Calcium-dependent protein kinase n=1 Tax=Sesamum latifolium TaxID=2727402 RepID=A0AAW2SMY4_9LAMI